MISLKGIKVYEGMSEETHCFEANLYVDNKKLGRVSNSGRGGSNNYDFHWKEEEKLDEWCKNNLPKYKSPFDDEECYHNLETHIGDLLTNHLEQKDLKKLISSSVIVVDDNCSSGEAYRWNFSKYKGTPKTTLLNNIKRLIDKNEKMINPIILNSLPFDVAFKTFYK